jgi:hypothetical protein
MVEAWRWLRSSLCERFQFLGLFDNRPANDKQRGGDTRAGDNQKQYLLLGGCLGPLRRRARQSL